MTRLLEPADLHLRISAIRDDLIAEATRMRTAGRPDEVSPRKTTVYALEDALNAALSVVQILIDIDIATDPDATWEAS